MKSLQKKLYFSNVEKVWIPILAMGLAAFTGCSDSEKTAGGGSSGTEAGNAIVASFVDGSTPAARIKVNLIESETLDFASAGGSYTAKADDKGTVEFNDIPKGSYTLEAISEGKAVQVPVEVTEDGLIDLGMNKLEEIATITGSVGSTANGTIKLRGLDHEANVVQGEFTLESVPTGPISMVFVPKEDGDTTSSYLTALSGKKISASTFASESKSLLLDDFEDGNFQHRFMPAHTYDGGWWYFSYEYANVTPSFIDEDQHFAIEEEDGNKFAHVGVEFGDIVEDSTTGFNTYPWAVMGIEIGKSDSSYCNDISSIDSVSFKIKSTVNMVFIVLDKTKASSADQEVLRFEVSQYENWTKVSVPLKDNAGKTDLTCASQFAWRFNGSGEVWLDDVELIGGNRLSIWKK